MAANREVLQVSQDLGPRMTYFGLAFEATGAAAAARYTTFVYTISASIYQGLDQIDCECFLSLPFYSQQLMYCFGCVVVDTKFCATTAKWRETEWY
jgi:hypothetical protein